ncbi:MAG: tRNA-dihydrouridine synthase family protein [Verrucomicrobiota bacterium]|nr:tRNA-dihydrouridine synthase family protein [Verrucomicrobiota bacterium]
MKETPFRSEPPVEAFRRMLASGRSFTALAPMQAISSLEFWRVMHTFGGPDVYFTEYFRVHSTSRLNPFILRSIDENRTGRPVIAQMIGNDIPSLIRTAKELEKHAIAGIDLNLGCPAPIVYKKCAGGGLLRDPERVKTILGALRNAIEIPFTVKTRLGFNDTRGYDQLLSIFASSSIDLLTIHGRTVKQMYRSEVDYGAIRMATQTMTCPVLANGNVYSALHAMKVMRLTQTQGWMIGRGAIRNPWLFNQIRALKDGLTFPIPCGWDVLDYIKSLYETLMFEPCEESAHVRRLKKYMNFIALGIDPRGFFLDAIRKTHTKKEFFDVCREHLQHKDPMPLEPYEIPMKPRDVLAGAHR